MTHGVAGRSVVALAFGVASAIGPVTTSALEINAPGHYVIDNMVDEVIISDIETSRDVSIEVVSGGVVAGDIRCAQVSDDCEAKVTVSGHGVVQGEVVGADGNVVLRDHARVGGAGAGSYTGAAVYVSDNAHLDYYVAETVGLNRLVMTGGYVGRNISTTEAVSVDISGGTIGSFHQLEGLYFRMSGGRILDGIYTGEGGRFTVKDGEIWGGIDYSYYEPAYGENSISGGAFNANSDEYLLRYAMNDTLTISGGVFGNVSQGSGLYFGRSGTVNIWGYDLALMDGQLTGYLLDGSYLSVRTTFGDDWTGTLNFINVPEPGTLALLGLGLAGLGLSRRRKA